MGRIVGPVWRERVGQGRALTAERETLLAHRRVVDAQRGEGSEWQHCTLEEGEPHGSALIVRIAGLDDREDAAMLLAVRMSALHARVASPPARTNSIGPTWSVSRS